MAAALLAPTPCHPQQHIHQLRSLWPPGRPSALKCGSSSSSSFKGPLVLLQPVQTGRGNPWLQGQARVPPAPSRCQPAPRHSCSPATVTRLRTSPAPGRNETGSGPGGRSEAGGRAEATCAACHICKGSTRRVSTTRVAPRSPPGPSLPTNPQEGIVRSGASRRGGGCGVVDAGRALSSELWTTQGVQQGSASPRLRPLQGPGLHGLSRLFVRVSRT